MAVHFHVFASGIITIATGSVVGLYYPSGGAICRVYNLKAKDNTKCIVESTPGSEYNLNAAEGGLNNFAFVQADELFSYLKKKEKDKKISTIKMVFPLYTETFVVVVSKNSGITSLSDIKGKTINIGVDGSGIRNFTSKIVEHLGMKSTDFKKIVSENQSSSEHLICNNEIDASLFIGGQPSPVIQNLLENCGAKIISLPQDFLDTVMNLNGFYSVVKIPNGMYYNQVQPVSTIGTKAVLITSQYTDNKIVNDLTTYIIENFESFKQYSPVVQSTSVESINPNISNFPVHPAALKAFKEHGISN